MIELEKDSLGTKQNTNSSRGEVSPLEESVLTRNVDIKEGTKICFVVIVIFIIIFIFLYVMSSISTKNLLEKRRAEIIAESQKQMIAEKRKQNKKDVILRNFGVGKRTNKQEKNDLLNAKIREREEYKKQQELLPQDDFDYAKEVETYNAEVRRIKAEKQRQLEEQVKIERENAELEAKELAERQRLADLNKQRILQQQKEQMQKKEQAQQKLETSTASFGNSYKVDSGLKKGPSRKMTPKKTTTITQRNKLQTHQMK